MGCSLKPPRRSSAKESLLGICCAMLVLGEEEADPWRLHIEFVHGLMFWFMQLENREGNAVSRDGDNLVIARRIHFKGLIIEFPRKAMAFIIRIQHPDCKRKKSSFCVLYICENCECLKWEICIRKRMFCGYRN